MNTFTKITLTARSTSDVHIDNPVRTRLILGVQYTQLATNVLAYGLRRMDDIKVEYITQAQADRVINARSGDELERVNDILYVCQ